MLVWNFSFRTGMVERLRFPFLILLASAALAWPNTLSAEQITVRHVEGVVHGFLVLRTLDGEVIANGDLKQVVKGSRVTDHLFFGSKMVRSMRKPRYSRSMAHSSS